MSVIDIQFGGRFPQTPTKKELKHWVNTTLQKMNIDGKISIRIVDEAEMLNINSTFRKKDKPTNILSFPCQLPEEFRGDILGDLVICAPIVFLEAKDQEKTLKSHWAHMVVHGVLHLLGYDHEIEKEALKMEQLEITILNEIGFSNPYGVSLTHE